MSENDNWRMSVTIYGGSPDPDGGGPRWPLPSVDPLQPLQPNDVDIEALRKLVTSTPRPSHAVLDVVAAAGKLLLSLTPADRADVLRVLNELYGAP